MPCSSPFVVLDWCICPYRLLAAEFFPAVPRGKGMVGKEFCPVSRRAVSDSILPHGDLALGHGAARVHWC